MSQFNEFLASKLNNAWLETSEGKVYIRKSHRLPPDHTALVRCLDIASIEMPNAGLKLIKELHKHNPLRFTFIEQVLNQKLARYLDKTGWKRVEYSGIPSFYLERP
jgi:hypothetical protein